MSLRVLSHGLPSGYAALIATRVCVHFVVMPMLSLALITHREDVTGGGSIAARLRLIAIRRPARTVENSMGAIGWSGGGHGGSHNYTSQDGGTIAGWSHIAPAHDTA